MTFSLLSLSGAVICVTFFFCGIVDAVCGGGGLISMPMFMAVGFPVHMITGTNQWAIVCGGATALARYARGGRVQWRSAVPVAVLAAAAAALGARLNLIVPDEWLEPLMIILVPLAACTALIRRKDGDTDRSGELSPARFWISAAVLAIVVGLYQGFYGAGSGTFFMLGFALLLRMDLTTASGSTKLVGLCCAVSSAVTYALAGSVVWEAAAVATVFNIAGNYVGAELAMKKGARFIRPMFLAVLALLFIRLVTSRM